MKVLCQNFSGKEIRQDVFYPLDICDIVVVLIEVFRSLDNLSLLDHLSIQAPESDMLSDDYKGHVHDIRL